MCWLERATAVVHVRAVLLTALLTVVAQAHHPDRGRPTRWSSCALAAAILALGETYWMVRDQDRRHAETREAVDERASRRRWRGVGHARISARPPYCAFLSSALTSANLAGRAFELVVEQPHRVEDLAVGRRGFRPVRLAEGEDGVVAQVAHDARVGDAIGREVAGRQRRARRRGHDLDQLEQLHLVDLIGQHLHDRRDLREQVGVRVHQPVAHAGPVVVALVALADARHLLGVARNQRRVERRDLGQDRCPRALPLAILRDARLEAALVLVGAGVADVLPAVGLGEKHAQADAGRRVGGRGIEALGARDDTRKIDDVLERRLGGLRVVGRRLHGVQQRPVLFDQRLDGGVEVGRRHVELVGPADARGLHVGQVLVGLHHLQRVPDRAPAPACRAAPACHRSAPAAPPAPP